MKEADADVKVDVPAHDDVQAHDAPKAAMWKRVLIGIAGLLLIGLTAFAQANTAWQFRGSQVDESELIHYAVGFFGGDFDPGWYIYGPAGMYLLYAVYALLALPAIGLGEVASFDAYVQQVFHDGFFFIVARYVFAVLGVLTVVVYARAAAELNISRWLVGSFVVISVASHDALQFANYVRTDTIVALFTAICVLCYVRSKRVLYGYGLALGVAAAIAAKISALPLVLLLVVAIIVGYRSHEWSRKHVLGIAVTFIIALFAFQPHTPLLRLLYETFISRGVNTPFWWNKPTYGSTPARALAILAVWREYVTLPVLLLAPLAFLKPRSRVRSALAVALFALTAPYLFSTEITDYWFAPVFHLLRFAAVLGVANLADLLLPAMSRLAGRRAEGRRLRPALSFALALALLVLVVSPVRSHLGAIESYRHRTHSNRDLAARWLEEEALGDVPILIDSSFNHTLPAVFDPTDLDMSKNLSRVFIEVYNRHEHPYLTRAFNAYLRRYAKRVDVQAQFARLRMVELRPELPVDGKAAYQDVALCRRDGSCAPPDDVNVNPSTRLLAQEAADIEVQRISGMPSVSLFGDDRVRADGSAHLRFISPDGGGKFVLHYSEGFGEPEVGLYEEDVAQSVLVRRARDQDLVERMNPFDVSDAAAVDAARGAYFVTSDAAVETFLKHSGEGLAAAREQALAFMRDFYEYLIGNELVATFDQGVGPTIYVYALR